MLYKAILAGELKADIPGRTITGYFAAFGNRDLVGDIVEPGAFTKTISERFANGKKLIKLSGSSDGMARHQAIVGLPTNLGQDSKGGFFEGKVDDTEAGNETLTRVQSGSLSHGSMGYDSIRAEMTQDGVDDSGWPIMTRHLLECKLFDVGPVDFPANEDAAISSQIKALVGADDPLVICTELPRLLKSLSGRGRLTLEERKFAHGLLTGLPGVIDELKALLAPEGTTATRPDPTTPAGMDAKSLDRFGQITRDMRILARELRGAA